MILIGTSGYNYPEWKGSFYPADLPAAKMLPYYAARFYTVEINYTFYRMPTPKLVAGWCAQVPEKLSLHAEVAAPHHPRQATAAGRRQRLAARRSSPRPPNLARGWAPCCSSCPPNFKKDVGRAVGVPDAAAAEGDRRVRVPARLVAERGRLRVPRASRKVALCIADSDTRETPVITTADYAYLRLRDEGYTPDDVERWSRHRARAGVALPRRLRVLQARRRGQGGGVRADDAGAACR